jgi:glycosyltransferase involved in cell wall biosynthesis
MDARRVDGSRLTAERADGARHGEARPAMLISVVIPTYNRAALLGRSIPLLMRQRVSPNVTYEVIFVNNGSADETESVLRTAADRYPGRVRYFTISPSGGPATPRNVGIRAARGPVVVILDDDVLPEPDLVEQHAAYHERFPQREAAAVGVAYVPDSVKDDPVSFFHEFDYASIEHSDTVSYTYFWTCNLSIKRDFMLTCGMFDERFLYNEDLVCGRSLARHGMQLRYLPTARGQHIHQLKLADAPAKGRFVGRWIWATTQLVPEPDILDQYGVLSPRIGVRRFGKRLLNRLAFPLLDNALARAALRLMGAESGKRSRVSDLYYYVAYRSRILAGYREARRAARRQRREGVRVEPHALVRSLPS